MTDINTITSRIGEIDAELESLATMVDPTDEDVTRGKALVAERTELKLAADQAVSRVQAIMDTVKEARSQGRPLASGGSFQFMQRVDPYEVDTRMLDDRALLDSARSILDRDEARHLEPEAKSQFENELRKHSKDGRLARYTIATSNPAYRSAFAKALAGQQALWDNDERRAMAMAEHSYRADLALADANGGYAVPALLDTSIIWTGSKNTHPMRSISRVVTGMDDTWRGVASTGMTAATVGEATAFTNNEPTLSQPTVTAYKVHSYVEYSWEIAEDWSSLTSEIMMGINEAFDDWETTAFGTGTTPVGIVTALVAGSGTVSNVAPTTDGQLGAVDVRALFAALPQKFRANATWLSSIDVQNEIAGFDTTGGLSLQTVALRDAPFSYSLQGKPYAELASMDSFTGTTGVANLLIVGDFRKYVIFDRIGQRVVPVPVVVDGSGVPTGQSGLAVYRRIGADSVADNAFRLLRNT